MTLITNEKYSSNVIRLSNYSIFIKKYGHEYDIYLFIQMFSKIIFQMTWVTLRIIKIILPKAF